MKKLLVILAVVSLVMPIVACSDNLTTRERHDQDYARNKANVEKYKSQCYQGNKRACKIIIYSADQVERYLITYPGGK